MVYHCIKPSKIVWKFTGLPENWNQCPFLNNDKLDVMYSKFAVLTVLE